jgi:hypothetical protein
MPAEAQATFALRGRNPDVLTFTPPEFKATLTPRCTDAAARHRRRDDCSTRVRSWPGLSIRCGATKFAASRGTADISQAGQIARQPLRRP